MRFLRIAMAQINTTVGDLDGNLKKMDMALEKAQAMKVDILLFPELTLTGYPPEDLLLKPEFIQDNLEALDRFARKVTGLVCVVGYVDRKDDIYDAAAVIYQKKVRGVYHKMYLPNYGVFDENRYFCAGQEPLLFQWGDVRFGVNVCEDIWYSEGPASIQSHYGADLLLNLSSSPYQRGKSSVREQMIRTRARDHGVFIAYCNQVGGQDELIFDGCSLMVGPSGSLLGCGKAFTEDFIVGDIDLDEVARVRLKNPLRRKQKKVTNPSPSMEPQIVDLPKSTHKAELKREPLIFQRHTFPNPIAEVYEALKLGVHDYVSKNGFGKVVIGLSGGIDSALVATIAVDALGAKNVSGVFMPTRFSFDASREDAEGLVKNLKIRYQEYYIDELFQQYRDLLADTFKNKKWDTTEENLQARIRGNLLMALSNKFGCLVLTTGNKSEMSTGYATLYGDMAGGFAVIKDVPKTLVFEICRYVNQVAGYDRIPERVITKPPTAELRDNQKDTDSLPPYDVLDPILQAYVEEDKSYEEIVQMGNDPDIVKRVIRMVDINEYKRRQAPPGIKITARAFGKDRRMPITNRYKGF